MTTPKTFIDLSAAYKSPLNSFVNIIGTVVDIQKPTPTRTGEWMITFKLLDDQIQNALYGSEGLRVRFFNKDIKRIPPVRQHGDVVLLRNVKMTHFTGQPIALSNIQTQVLIFPVASIPTPNFEIAYQDKKRLQCLGSPLDMQTLKLEEQAYVIKLKAQMSPIVDLLPPVRFDDHLSSPRNAPTQPAAIRKRAGEDLQSDDAKRARSSTFGPKYRKVSEVRHYDFADLCVLVVKKFQSQSGACELYVTDFTENKELYLYLPPEAEADDSRDGDQYGYSGGQKKQWSGPYGQQVLKIDVMSPHAEYANREIAEGDLVLLQNVKLKSSPNSNGRLEGNMWQDIRNPQKIQIKKWKDMEAAEVVALNARKNRYWAARNAKVGDGNEENKKLTKRQRKKFGKQKRKDVTRQANNQHKDESDVAGKETDEVPNGGTKVKINPHVRCGHREVRISSLRDIQDPENKRHTNTLPDGTTYTLPFVNAKFRAQVRVVAFYPEAVEDFAVPESPDQSQPTEEDDSLQIDYDSSLAHRWSFSLLLEDTSSEKNRQWVYVGHEEAQYLFGKHVEDPTDLHQDRKLLAKIKEKLCILWGNLEEKVEGEEVSNLPFECCIHEYGVEVDEDDEQEAEGVLGFERRYRMFGVTIS